MGGPGPKTILAGKYRLVRQLGRGGMGSVWYAQHLTLQAPVAVKLMDPGIAQSAESLQRFLNEAKAAAALRSPHVVQVLDHGVDDGVPFIVMELLEGESLGDRLGARAFLTPVETSRIITQIARALARAHDAGIIHRDLKPENVFLVRNDEEEVVKILDFGVAKSTASGLALSAPIDTRSGIVLGTPFYMSPEQAEGKRDLDHRTDVWALGVIAFECLVGRLPFEGDTIGTLFLAICARRLPVPSEIGTVPPGFDDWFARVCARDPNDRIASARAAALELRRICEPGATLAAETLGFGDIIAQESAAPVARERVAANSVVGFSSSSGKGRAPFRRRRRRGITFATIVVALLVIGIGFVGWKRFAADPALTTGGASTSMSGPGGATVSRQAEPTVATAEPPLATASSAASPTAQGSTSPASTAMGPSASGPSPAGASATASSAARKAPAHRVARPASPKPAASAPPAHPKVNFGF